MFVDDLVLKAENTEEDLRRSLRVAKSKVCVVFGEGGGGEGGMEQCTIWKSKTSERSKCTSLNTGDVW